MVDVGQFEKRLPVGIVLVEKRASFELQKPDIAAAVFAARSPLLAFYRAIALQETRLSLSHLLSCQGDG